MTSTTEKVLVTALLLKQIKNQPQRPASGPMYSDPFHPLQAQQGMPPGGGFISARPQAAPGYHFGAEERPGAYAPNFMGFYGSGASQIGGGRQSGPLGGLDGYGGGFVGPVGGINGMIVGVNQGEGQGGPLGGLYSTLLGQAGYGEAGYNGGGFFPSGFLTGAR